MARVAVIVGGLAASLALAVTVRAAPALVVLKVSPSHVQRGHLVVITGNAGSCPVGDTVFIISRAFSRVHEFAGVPAVLAKVRTGGAFRATTRIPLRRRPGRYGITARCGGGNLGVLVRLTVRA
jgi:hypothetical protein